MNNVRATFPPNPRSVTAATIAVFTLFFIGCSRTVLITNYTYGRNEKTAVPSETGIGSNGFRRQIDAPIESVQTSIVKILSSTAMILESENQNGFLVSEIGTVRHKNSILFAEFPMAVFITGNDSQSTTIHVLPFDWSASRSDQKYRSAYCNRQEYYARRLMYRIAVEMEAKKRWSWLFDGE